MKTKLLLIAALVGLATLLFMPGCAVYSVNLETENRMTNGVVQMQRLKARPLAVWPATTEIARQKISVGKTLTLGVDGLREDGGGTNLVQGLRELGNILDKLSPK